MGHWSGDNSDQYSQEDTRDNVAQLRAYINVEALLDAARQDLASYQQAEPEFGNEYTLADFMREQLAALVEALEDDKAVKEFTEKLAE